MMRIIVYRAGEMDIKWADFTFFSYGLMQKELFCFQIVFSADWTVKGKQQKPTAHSIKKR